MTTLYEIYFTEEKGVQEISFEKEMVAFKNKVEELFSAFKIKIKDKPNNDMVKLAGSGLSRSYMSSLQNLAIQGYGSSIGAPTRAYGHGNRHSILDGLLGGLI